LPSSAGPSHAARSDDELRRSPPRRAGSDGRDLHRLSYRRPRPKVSPAWCPSPSIPCFARRIPSPHPAHTIPCRDHYTVPQGFLLVDASEGMHATQIASSNQRMTPRLSTTSGLTQGTIAAVLGRVRVQERARRPISMST